MRHRKLTQIMKIMPKVIEGRLISLQSSTKVKRTRFSKLTRKRKNEKQKLRMDSNLHKVLTLSQAMKLDH